MSQHPAARAISDTAAARLEPGAFATPGGSIWYARYRQDQTVILDEEGEPYATLPGLVDDPRLLAALVEFGQRRHADGQRVGRALFLHDLRKLLEVAGADDVEALRASMDEGRGHG